MKSLRFENTLRKVAPDKLFSNFFSFKTRFGPILQTKPPEETPNATAKTACIRQASGWGKYPINEKTVLEVCVAAGEVGVFFIHSSVSGLFGLLVAFDEVYKMAIKTLSNLLYKKFVF
jgi:hypothetical protein